MDTWIFMCMHAYMYNISNTDPHIAYERSRTTIRSTYIYIYMYIHIYIYIHVHIYTYIFSWRAACQTPHTRCLITRHSALRDDNTIKYLSFDAPMPFDATGFQTPHLMRHQKTCDEASHGFQTPHVMRHQKTFLQQACLFKRHVFGCAHLHSTWCLNQETCLQKTCLENAHVFSRDKSFRKNVFSKDMSFQKTSLFKRHVFECAYLVTHHVIRHDAYIKRHVFKRHVLRTQVFSKDMYLDVHISWRIMSFDMTPNVFWRLFRRLLLTVSF